MNECFTKFSFLNERSRLAVSVPVTAYSLLLWQGRDQYGYFWPRTKELSSWTGSDLSDMTTGLGTRSSLEDKSIVATCPKRENAQELLSQVRNPVGGTPNLTYVVQTLMGGS
jgi:hypothetical protein